MMILLLAALLTACSPMSAQEKAALKWRQQTFQRLQGNMAVPVSGRVQKMPADMLKALQEDDKYIGIAHTDLYLARSATDEELALIDSYIRQLPATYQSVFSKKLLAIYIVDRFAGAGLTNWLIDREGNAYYYIVFNSAILKTSIDDWVTYKENSIFDNTQTSPAIRIRSGVPRKALMYGLLHEGAHVLDYEFGVTPYVDPEFKKFRQLIQESTGFTEGVWLKRLHPVAAYDFSHRADMNVYAEFERKGLISRAELSSMFSELARTPFVTFYSGTSWAEDLADYMTYKFIEAGLGGRVKVELVNNGKVIDYFEPIKTDKSQERAGLVQKYIQ